MPRSANYKADLLDDLRNDLDFAAQYLSAARADSKEAFLVALRDVAEALMGMKKVAQEAQVNRENLYRALSKEGNPRIDTIDSVLSVLGMEYTFVPKRSAAAAAPAAAAVITEEFTSASTNSATIVITSPYSPNVAAVTVMGSAYTPQGAALQYSRVPWELLLGAQSTQQLRLEE